MVNCLLKDVQIGDVLLSESFPIVKSLGLIKEKHVFAGVPQGAIKLVFHPIVDGIIQYEYSYDFYVGKESETVLILRRKK